MPASVQQIISKQEEILERLSRIRTMERGTLSRQSYPHRAKRKNGNGAVGPYYLWQGTVGGKRFGKRISGAEAERVEAGIAQRHAFEALCGEYVELSCQLAASVKEGDISDETLKKKLKPPSNRTRK